ncbi:hypothetical protein [Kineosporia babensis]|uniref:Pectate lyase superfamily protein domain-containing protein n=1 Tax=Kineosporia babensis TaxID=499548 RepID=A0A9X1SSM8_9ACTN|nr:hypothetical protein [Kineosporia babensis]MCD5310827.1 hypothetical protein [Kineosporia babensis]
MAAPYQFRRGTRAAAVASARVLLDGEPAITRDGGVSRLLLGDGTTPAVNLPWLASGPPSIAYADDPRFGASKNGRRVSGGVTTAGSTTFTTSGTNPFNAASVGSIIVIPGAGPGGIPLVTTITGFVGVSQVTLAATASTAVSGQHFFLGHDDSPALQAAINAAGQGGTVILGAGTYMLGSMVTALAGRVKILGGNANLGTVLLAGAIGMTMMKVSSSTVVEDLHFDGCRIGAYGLQTVHQANKIHFSRVRAENCEAGFVYDGTQNSITIDCFANYCTYSGFFLVNGVMNTKFVNINTNADVSAAASYRGIRIDNSTDPRLDGGVVSAGNREISIWGGIHERGSADHYQMEIAVSTGYVTVQEAEFTTAKTSILTGPGMHGELYLERVQFNMSAMENRAVEIQSSPGRVHVDGVTYHGTNGQHEDVFYLVAEDGRLTFASKSTDIPRNLFGTHSYFTYGKGNWQAAGSGTATWDGSGPGRLALTSIGPGHGARCFWRGTGAIRAGQQAKISFFVESITGGAQVGLRMTTNSGSKALATTGSYGAGEHTVITRLDGDETGILIGAATSTSISAVIGYMTISVF